jgi:Protein of unknown function (DUF2934)
VDNVTEPLIAQEQSDRMDEKDPLQQAIVKRARELWEARGREEGHAEEDWLRAEADVKASIQKTACIVVRVRGTTYVGEYDLGRCDCYKPGDLQKGTTIPVRFENDKMYVGLPGQKELETRVVGKTEC